MRARAFASGTPHACTKLKRAHQMCILFGWTAQPGPCAWCLREPVPAIQATSQPSSPLQREGYDCPPGHLLKAQERANHCLRFSDASPNVPNQSLTNKTPSMQHRVIFHSTKERARSPNPTTRNAKLVEKNQPRSPTHTQMRSRDAKEVVRYLWRRAPLAEAVEDPGGNRRSSTRFQGPRCETESTLKPAKTTGQESGQPTRQRSKATKHVHQKMQLTLI